MFNGFGFSIRNWKTAVNYSVETETPLLKPKNRLDFVLIYRRMIVINIERTKTAVDTETADKPRQLLTNWSAQTRSWFVCFLSEPYGSSSKRFELKLFFLSIRKASTSEALASPSNWPTCYLPAELPWVTNLYSAKNLTEALMGGWTWHLSTEKLPTAEKEFVLLRMKFCTGR